MGLTFLEIEVGNPSTPEVTERLEVLLDSGAIDSVVPTPLLDRLGIRPLADQEAWPTARKRSARKVSRCSGMRRESGERT
jgi:hypothetical protein